MRSDTLRSLRGLLVASALTAAMAGCALDVGDTDDELAAEDGGGAEDGTAHDGDAIGQASYAATAHLTGWHSVCASSLTLHMGGGNNPDLHRGWTFYIDHFADGYNHAWGWAYAPFQVYIGWGWVYNGWFC